MRATDAKPVRQMPAARRRITAMLKFLKWMFTRCQCCRRLGARRTRQNTAYHNDEDNWKTLCPECQKANDEHWAEAWQEYYSGMGV